MNKILIIMSAAAAVLLSSKPAESQCPAGLVHAGKLYAQTPEQGGPNTNHEFKGDKDIIFPGVKLDKSYHQSTVTASGGGAASKLTAAQIPAGIFINPGGTTGNDKRWAVDDPRLVGASVDEDNVVTQWEFRMYMYADAGSGEADRFNGGANVHVDVCYKPLSGKHHTAGKHK